MLTFIMQGLTLTAGRLEKNPPKKAKEQGFQLAESYESSLRRARKGSRPRIVENDMKIGRMWRPALVAMVPSTPPHDPPECRANPEHSHNESCVLHGESFVRAQNIVEEDEHCTVWNTRKEPLKNQQAI